MASSTLYCLLVIHLQCSCCPRLQVNEINSVIANSTLPTYVVCTHSSKYNNEPIFVKNGAMIASGWHCIELFYPSLPVKRINLSNIIRKTTMPTNNNCNIFIYSSGMAFSCLRFPPFYSISIIDDSILNIFGDGLYNWFFNDFPYFSV